MPGARKKRFKGKPTTIRCSVTGKEVAVTATRSGQPSLPLGWKRLGQEVYSPEAWHNLFAARMLTIPVAQVLTEGPWQQARADFRSDLASSCRLTTQVHNWFLTEWVRHDAPPTETKPGVLGIARWSPPDLNAQARARFPELDSQSLYYIARQVANKYRSIRYSVHVSCAERLPLYQYPQPLPIPASCVSLEVNEQRQPCVECRINGRRWRLRLRNGYQYDRQINSLLAVQAGQAQLGAIQVRFKRGDVLVGLSVWLRKEKQQLTERCMFVVTGRDSLFQERVFAAGLDERANLWLYNADDVWRRIAHHERRRQRWSEDSKCERRANRTQNALLQEEVQIACRKHADHVNDCLQKASTMLANLARRNRIGKVIYHDAGPAPVKEGEPAKLPFPWFRLRNLVVQKLDAFGATLELIDHSAIRPEERCLIEPQEQAPP